MLRHLSRYIWKENQLRISGRYMNYSYLRRVWVSNGLCNSKYGINIIRINDNFCEGIFQLDGLKEKTIVIFLIQNVIHETFYKWFARRKNATKLYLSSLFQHRFAFSDNTELTNSNNCNVHFFYSLFTHDKYVIGVIAYCLLHTFIVISMIKMYLKLEN